MRIGLYHPRAVVGDGGITRSVLNLTREFAEMGETPRVIFEDTGVPPPDLPGEWVGLDHVGSGPFNIPSGAADALEDVDVVVLHSAWTIYNYAFAKAAMKAGVPFVLAPRGAYDPRIVARRKHAKRAFRFMFESELIANAAAVHAFFDSQVAHAEALGFVGPAIVAPNGATVPDPGSWDGGSSGRILFVGRFDPEHKGLDLLVGAVAALDPSERPQLLLRGPDWKGGKERVIQDVAQRGLNEWIEIGNPVYGPEKWQTLQSALAFVYPSRWEAFGNAPAEAAATGVPTITTEYPLGVYLGDRGAALTASATTESLAAALLSAGTDDAAEVGCRASTVMQEFSWGSVAKLWADQLRQVAVKS